MVINLSCNLFLEMFQYIECILSGNCDVVFTQLDFLIHGSLHDLQLFLIFAFKITSVVNYLWLIHKKYMMTHLYKHSLLARKK